MGLIPKAALGLALLAVAPGDAVVVWIDHSDAPARGAVQKVNAPCLEIEWVDSKGSCAPRPNEINPKRELFPISPAPARLTPIDSTKRYRELQPGDEVQWTRHSDSICSGDVTLVGKVSARLECATVKRTDFAWPALTVRAEEVIPVRPDGGAPPTYETVQAIAKEHRAALQACLTAHPQRWPDAWSVRIHWIVLPDGTLTKLETEPYNYADEAIQRCLRDEVSGWRFPSSTEGARALLIIDKLQLR